MMDAIRWRSGLQPRRTRVALIVEAQASTSIQTARDGAGRCASISAISSADKRTVPAGTALAAVCLVVAPPVHGWLARHLGTLDDRE